MSKSVTKAQGQKVLKAVLKAFPAYIDTPPTLSEDGQEVVWEEGPFQWTYSFPYGGRDEEFGGTIKDVSDLLPAEVEAQANTHYSVSLYRV